VDNRSGNRLHRIAAAARLAILATVVCTSLSSAGCVREAGDTADAPAATPGSGSAATNCLPNGEFSGRVVGSLQGQLDWRGGQLSCTGMRRPNDAGVRLRFAGPIALPGGRRELAVIIALPELARGATVAETPAKVTMIEEDTGRFFTSGNAEICWSDIERQAPLSGTSSLLKNRRY